MAFRRAFVHSGFARQSSRLRANGYWKAVKDGLAVEQGRCLGILPGAFGGGEGRLGEDHAVTIRLDAPGEVHPED